MREGKVEIPGFEAKTLLIDLGEKRRFLSTPEGFKYAGFTRNHYDLPELSDCIHGDFKAHTKWLPKVLGIKEESSTGGHSKAVELKKYA